MSKYRRYERYKDSGVEWIGEIPEEWEVSRLKDSIKSCRNGIWGDEPQGTSDDIACIRVTDFNRTNMEIEVNDLTIRNIPASKQKMYLLKNGDLLIEKSGGGEKQPVGFVTIFNHDIPAVYANFIARMELEEGKAYSDFYKYVHSTMYSVRLNVRSIKQTTGIQNLDTNYYFEENVVYPPIKEQKAIANFLDQKTAEIDGLIADKEKLIELLQEKRQAIISEAVTKGLNPNVKMKDSGIEWIGEIPEHWEVTKIKYLAFLKSGENITSEMLEEQGDYPVYGGNGLRGYASSYTHEGNYVLIGRQGALCGNINYAQGKFWASEHAVVVTPLRDVDLTWLGELLRSMNLNQYSISAAQPGLSVNNVQNLFIPVPPYSEQCVISCFLKQNIADIEKVIQDTRKQIIKFKEYRQSLIFEAVTGKIDVRDYAVG